MDGLARGLVVYLASPLGFAESTQAYMELLIGCLEGLRLQVLNPWTAPELMDARRQLVGAERVLDLGERQGMLRQADQRIAAANEWALRQADVVVAVLDGVDVDSGTAAEIGFAVALGRPVFGLRTDIRRSGENDGVLVNLQVQWWIEQSGGIVARTRDELVDALRVMAHPSRS